MKDIEKNEILKAQEKWKNGIIDIGNKYINDLNYEERAIEHIKELYAYGVTDVLFKPTKVSKIQFRSTFEEALSYFVASNSVCLEDKGFALEPWIDIRFENSNILIQKNTALAMGNYFFTNSDSKVSKVEYTFGYLKMDEKILINLHHSSIPYQA